MANSAVKLEDFARVKLTRLQKLVDQKSSNLAWYHAVGRLVKDLLPDRGYREKRMEGLVEILGGKSKKVSVVLLYTAREFIRTYREQDLPKLQGLTFTHVCRLITVEAPKRQDWYRQ